MYTAAVHDKQNGTKYLRLSLEGHHTKRNLHSLRNEDERMFSWLSTGNNYTVNHKKRRTTLFSIITLALLARFL